VSYTALAILGVVAAVLLDLVILRTRLLTRRVFWVPYAIVVGFQLLVNGVLAGRNIVRYDSGTITGWRIAGAPVEDLLFGFSLVTQTLCWWVWWGRRLPDPGVGGDRARRVAASAPEAPADAGPDGPGSTREAPPTSGGRRRP
jgi:lycopene cyclase domain-containing protein